MNLVIGASGFIGNALLRAQTPGNCTGTYFSYPLPGLQKLDITRSEDIEDLVRITRPDTIFLPAALPNVDWCERNQRLCRDVNVKGAENVARAARNAKAKLVFFSTDYIFDGVDGPYDENDTPNPVNVYGEAKLAAERIIPEILNDYLIIRVTVVYGTEIRGKNFIAHLVRSLKAGNPMKVPMDQVGSPTYVENLVQAVLSLARLNQNGIFNITGGHQLNRYEFAVLAADIFGLDSTLIQPVTTAELGQTARRPLNAGLTVDKARSVLGPVLLGPEKGLAALKEKYFTKGNGLQCLDSDK